MGVGKRASTELETRMKSIQSKFSTGGDFNEGKSEEKDTFVIKRLKL